MAEGEETTGPEAQRLRNLSRANRIRSERAELKRALRRGDKQLAILLLDPPACIETATVDELLLAVPGIGTVRVRRLLAAAEISPRKRVDGLSERQRDALLGRLADWS